MTSILKTSASDISSSDAILKLLRHLRRRIRWYVVGEGFAVLTIWLVGAFWLGLTMDYLPVLVGASEMPRSARRVVLLCAMLGGAWIVYLYVVRRVFTTFQGPSLALLIERQFPSFRDSLVTAVEMDRQSSTSLDEGHRRGITAAAGSTSSSQLGSTMLADTLRRAQAGVNSVDLASVFNYGPIAMKALLATAGLVSLLGLGLFGGNALSHGAARLLLLSDAPWPRRARIELVDFDAEREKKIAKGTDLILRVRAEATRQYPAPELCSILYETMDGDRGRVNMSRDGEPRDGFQYYVFNGKPFKAILDDIHFDVIGFDHRLRDCLVRVVASPVVSGVELHSQLPEYTELLTREETWAPGMQLPIGSRVTVQLRANKDLVAATLHDLDSRQEQTLDFSNQPRQEFTYPIGELQGRVSVAVTLADIDGIQSLEPFLLTIGALEDTAPKVDVSLRGIGSAITSAARLPIEGSIADDYLVDRCWFELEVDGASRQFEFEVPYDAEFSTALDLREQRAATKDIPFILEPQQQVVFTVKASDRYNLKGESHVGANEPTTLSVVRPDELLAILDGRELGLRRRFEQIRTEMLQSRDSLARLRVSFRGDAQEQNDRDSIGQNLVELRERWAGWAAQKANQSVLEIEGVALAFEDIREELINNRVDTPERKQRMESQIIGPLKSIAKQRFPRFMESLEQLRGALSLSAAPAESHAIEVVQHADDILAAMDAILDKMIELEDYTELVNILRQIIEQQESLREKTKEEQKARVLDLFK